MIGLKRGDVKLCEHEKEWEIEAENTILRLRKILGGVITDIQHVGSTSVPSIKAKPIIDIALAADRFEDILAYEKELRDEGFYYRLNGREPVGRQLLFACGSYYDGTGDLQTHFIHVVLTNSEDWVHYVNFRDYLNDKPAAAKEYENLKVSLARGEGNRQRYTEGKHDFIVRTLRSALAHSYLGKTVDIKIDRPLGSVHPKYADMTYPVNYGFVPGVLGGDGEELDAYLLKVDEPVKEYRGRVIGVVYRKNDAEDKLVAAPEGVSLSKEEIERAVDFQERYFESEIEI